ncbi:unnamed protein product [marine sediment metagenome]|uniref:Uncharacterized protein n=1 Tax=marine sediment metagenome TaxID=412755 RepID=X1QUU4_9ZZZZ
MREKFHTITWFGSLAMDNFVPSKEFVNPNRKHKRENCPFCGGEIKPIRPLNAGIEVPSEEREWVFPSAGWVYSNPIYVSRPLPEEFLKKPRLEDGSLNWGGLLITEAPVGAK